VAVAVMVTPAMEAMATVNANAEAHGGCGVIRRPSIVRIAGVGHGNASGEPQHCKDRYDQTFHVRSSNPM
jgi:hypothetical protein